MAVQYLCDVAASRNWQVNFIRKPVPRRGMLQLAPGQGADGYGKKISTDYMAVIDGRRHRVYAICYSNAASHYVLIGGASYYIRDYDIPDSVRK